MKKTDIVAVLGDGVCVFRRQDASDAAADGEAAAQTAGWTPAACACPVSPLLQAQLDEAGADARVVQARCYRRRCFVSFAWRSTLLLISIVQLEAEIDGLKAQVLCSRHSPPAPRLSHAQCFCRALQHVDRTPLTPAGQVRELKRERVQLVREREGIQLVREREGPGDAWATSGAKGVVLQARNQGGEDMSLQDMFTGLQRSLPPLQLFSPPPSLTCFCRLKERISSAGHPQHGASRRDGSAALGE